MDICETILPDKFNVLHVFAGGRPYIRGNFNRNSSKERPNNSRPKTPPPPYKPYEGSDNAQSQPFFNIDVSKPPPIPSQAATTG